MTSARDDDGSRLVKLEMFVAEASVKAYKCTQVGHAGYVWLPKAETDITDDDIGKRTVVTMPAWPADANMLDC